MQPRSLLAGGRAEGRVPVGSQHVPRRPQKDAEPQLRGRAHPTAPRPCKGKRERRSPQKASRGLEVSPLAEGPPCVCSGPPAWHWPPARGWHRRVGAMRAGGAAGGQQGCGSCQRRGCAGQGLGESHGRRALRVQFSQESLRRSVGDSWKYCSWGHGSASGDGLSPRGSHSIWRSQGQGMGSCLAAGSGGGNPTDVGWHTVQPRKSQSPKARG